MPVCGEGGVIDRRTFLAGATLGLVAAPLAAEAQSAGKVWRIGVIGFAPATAEMVGPEPPYAYVRALLEGLRERGYVYGRDFVTEPRGAEGKPERLPGLVDELVRLQVDVIVPVGAALPALKQAASTIPVVIPGAGDPVGSGYARSLARPGGSFTGYGFQFLDLVVKRLDLLKELLPMAGTVAVIWDVTSPKVWEVLDAAARERRWKLRSLPISDVGEAEDVVRAAAKARAAGLLVTAGVAFDPHPRRIVEPVAKYRLPAMYHQRSYVQAGGLMSYAPDLLAIWRAAAAFVDKILKGAKPGDLPFEQPTKFLLVINLKTAKALGLTLPRALLLRADELIE
jgi:putative ABC transport system substrate-binding protein